MGSEPAPLDQERVGFDNELEAAYHMGTPLSLHAAPTFLKGLGALASCLVGLVLLYFEHYNFGLVVCGWGVVTGYRVFLDRSVRILLFPAGIVHVAKDQVRALRWEQIASVRQVPEKQEVESSRSLVVDRIDGISVEIPNSLRGYDTLSQAILQETLERKLPAVASRIHHGKTVAFGKYGVNIEGISAGADFLPWEQVTSINDSNNEIQIMQRDARRPWSKAAIGTIPNAHVLLAMAQHINSIES